MKARVGIAAIVVTALGFTLLKSSSSPSSEASVVRARLTDVRALPVGAPVTIAGLPVGEIVKRRVGSGYAEVDILFRDNIDLRKDATLFKRRISLLSGPSLEIDPGESSEKLPGKYIERVVETSPIGDVLYEISEALPGLREGAEDGMLRAERMRARVNGPFKERVLEFDEAAEDIAGRVHGRLEKMDRALQRGEDIHFDPRRALLRTFNRAEELTVKARDNLERARGWTVENATMARQKVEETRVDWSEFSGPLRDIDKGQGTLGTLLNNGEIHDDIVEITADTRNLIRSVANWKMQVGLKTEVGYHAREPTGYVTVKAGRADRYYYIELVGSSRGANASASVAYDGSSDAWNRNITIADKLRFTAQYATRLGPAVFRYGFKESTFGVGSDVELIDSRLNVSADIFEVNAYDLPRVKVAASLRLFGHLYMLAGLDDALNAGKRITTGPDGGVQGRSETYIGRDYFLGGGVEFSDRDLIILMRIGGAVMSALDL